MSHFSVLVVGDDVDEQLAPYQEFESTGVVNQYVQTIDITEKARANYVKDDTYCAKDPEGTLHQQFGDDGTYKDMFLREPTPEEKTKIGSGSGFGNGLSWTSRDFGDGRGSRTMIIAMPPGWKEVKIATPTLKSFEQFCHDYYHYETVPEGELPHIHGKHKYGYFTGTGENFKVIDRTNPNAKWDWYKIGGRFNGYFRLKAAYRGTGIIGEPGLQRMDKNYQHPSDAYADQCRKGMVDFEGMRLEAEMAAIAKHTLFRQLTAGCPPLIPWETCLADAKGDVQRARELYNPQPILKALRSHEEACWWAMDDLRLFTLDEASYVQRAREHAIDFYAFVLNGQWYEKGQMGWWGISHGDKDETTWLAECNRMLDQLPDETLLTVVDCHI